MDNFVTDPDLNTWFSSYGVITTERILGRYQITLPPQELAEAVKSPHSFYQRIIQVPLKNVLNGIILQQAKDYHLYTQKLFIDYLLSGQGSKGEEEQGASIREYLEEERKALTDGGEAFSLIEAAHANLIAASQAVLIKIVREWKAGLETALTQMAQILKNNQIECKPSQIRAGVNHALIHCDLTRAGEDHKSVFIDKFIEKSAISVTQSLKAELLSTIDTFLQIILDFDQQMEEFVAQALELGMQVREYRTQFYNTVIRVLDLLKLLPDYTIDPEQDKLNREPLYFDNTIGNMGV